MMSTLSAILVDIAVKIPRAVERISVVIFLIMSILGTQTAVLLRLRVWLD